MAIGLLGSSSSGVVYTVPNDISHAVVHITMSPSTSATLGPASQVVTLNSTPILSYVWGALGTTFYNTIAQVYGSSNSVSMMLSPGDVISVQGASCTVSGYEVPL